MIVSNAGAGLTSTVDGSAGQALWRCLGRRGMLFSECESFDFVRLAPGAVVDERGRDDIEEAWFVLRGSAEFVDDGGEPLLAGEGDVVFCSHAAGGRWRNAGDTPVEMVFLALMPASVSGRLPIRTPCD